ncbi:MAG: hypothetical protein HQ483_07145 [Rhodospirillales bacterium]|nr:hypothetical protein [Rhodospirillales bacterium]
MFGWFKSTKNRDQAHELYSALLGQARLPVFYTDYGVPDTVDGRFDMIVLHAHILFSRLKDGGADQEQLSQTVFDLMFADLDQNLREMGVGDIGVGKRIKAMAEAFYGRATAYADALKQADDGDLIAALRRNLYRKSSPTEAQAAAAAHYVRTQVAQFSAQDLNDLQKGFISFYAPKSLAATS